MKDRSVWKWMGYTTLFFIVLAGCLVCNLIWEVKAANVISIVGSVASMAGIIFAIYQVMALKTRTIAVEDALDEAKEKLAGITIFSDVNTHAQAINEIQAYIRHGKNESALIAYKELKGKMCKLVGYIEGRQELEKQHDQLNILVGEAGSDVNNLQRLVMDPKSSIIIDSKKMLENLESIKTLLDSTSGLLSRDKI